MIEDCFSYFISVGGCFGWFPLIGWSGSVCGSYPEGTAIVEAATRHGYDRFFVCAKLQLDWNCNALSHTIDFGY